MITDKAGAAYWDSAETNYRVRLFNPSGRSIRNHGARDWEKFFIRWLGNLPRGSRLLELGCGGSAMLPYLGSRFAFDISGLDYSAPGCRLAERMCAERGCTARIYCADAFTPPEELFDSKDIVVSFGLIEHFSDTAGAVAAFARFLAPDGIMITTVPNLTGWSGTLQRWFAPDILAKHVPLDAVLLLEAHRRAGLNVIGAGHLQFVNFGVVNPGPQKSTARRTAFQVLRALTGATWMFEEAVGALPPNRYTSPYVYCVARRTARLSASGRDTRNS